jgi:histidinol dehydrogenase
MKTYTNPPINQWESLIERPSFPAENLEEKVGQIIAQVQLNGDAALRQFSKDFDNVELLDLQVSQSEIEFAQTQVSEELKEAIEFAERSPLPDPADARADIFTPFELEAI